MRPTWEHTEKRENQNHDQYSSKHVLLLFPVLRPGIFILGCILVRGCTAYTAYIEMLIAIPTLGYRRLYK
jgi:hypothetical protein